MPGRQARFSIYFESKADVWAVAAKWRFVRVLPVHARRSEWRGFPNRPLVISAAKVSEEPFV